MFVAIGVPLLILAAYQLFQLARVTRKVSSTDPNELKLMENEETEYDLKASDYFSTGYFS